MRDYLATLKKTFDRPLHVATVGGEAWLFHDHYAVRVPLTLPQWLPVGYGVGLVADILADVGQEAPMARGRKFAKVGAAVLNLELVAIVERIHGAGLTWFARGPLDPAVAFRDGQAVAAVMPTRGTFEELERAKP